jgi:hypothetical protein
MGTLFVYVYLNCVKNVCTTVKSKDFNSLIECQKAIGIINGGYFSITKDVRKTTAACYENGTEPSVITE